MVYIDLEDETECFDSVKLYDGKNIRIGTIKKNPKVLLEFSTSIFFKKILDFVIYIQFALIEIEDLKALSIYW